jgi:glycosyltransferase involved in cell wall biosynthesis
MSKPQAEISLVVNIHRGAQYLKRTMLSLEMAAANAMTFGVRSELIFVMDRSSQEAISWVRAYRSDSFEMRRVLEVDYGSLGLSRNEGWRAAQAEIVLFCDEDDLISFNTLTEFYRLSISGGPKCVVVPEYFFGFSNEAFIVRYFGSGVYSPLQFITYNAFVSRICVRKAALQQTSYSDVQPSSGYAYEDWHLNTKLAALGFKFLVAPKTILFYRVRPNSLVKVMDAQTTKQIPPTSLFNPAEYLKVCSKDYRARDAISNLRQCEVANAFAVDEFFSSPLCLELTRAANLIDPGINALKIQGAKYTNIDNSLKRGTAYYKACQIVGDTKFTDVVLLPSQKEETGEIQIQAVLNVFEELAHGTRILVIAGERLPKQLYWKWFQENSIVIDWQSLEADLSDDDADVLTLKLIEATSPHARIHIKSSRFANRFVAKFSKLLQTNKIIFYRSFDEVTHFDELEFQQDDAFECLSKNIQKIALVVSNDRQLIEHDISRIDCGREKWILLSPEAWPAIGEKNAELDIKNFVYRLVWLQPLSERYKPHILFAIAGRLRQVAPKISIDVYGSTESFDSVQFENHSNLNYCGDSVNVAQIKPSQYDALICAPSCDEVAGLILEAMIAGLTAIAPDAGKMREVIIDYETGFLLPNRSEGELVNEYVNAIVALYASFERFSHLRRNARKRALRKSQKKIFFDQASEIFSLVQSE